MNMNFKVFVVMTIMFIATGSYHAAADGSEKSVQLVGNWPLNYSAKDILQDKLRPLILAFSLKKSKKQLSMPMLVF